MTITRKNLSLGLAIVMSACAMALQAKTCHWTGAGETGAWTDAGNWKGGDIPGRLGSLGEDATDVVGDFGDTAVFSAVADGAHTTLDLSGLRSIGHIVIKGAQAPVFTFGSTQGGGGGGQKRLRI